MLCENKNPQKFFEENKNFLCVAKVFFLRFYLAFLLCLHHYELCGKKCLADNELITHRRTAIGSFNKFAERKVWHKV